MSFCMAGPGRRKGCVCTLPKVRKHEGFAAVLKALAGMGHVKKTCKHAFRVPAHYRRDIDSDMFGGQGADLLREVALWIMDPLPCPY